MAVEIFEPIAGWIASLWWLWLMAFAFESGRKSEQDHDVKTRLGLDHHPTYHPLTLGGHSWLSFVAQGLLLFSAAFYWSSIDISSVVVWVRQRWWLWLILLFFATFSSKSERRVVEVTRTPDGGTRVAKEESLHADAGFFGTMMSFLFIASICAWIAKWTGFIS